MSIQNQPTVLHAAHPTPKMGSIGVYDHKIKRWVPYVPDYKKWSNILQICRKAVGRASKHLEENHDDQLSLFTPPPTNTATQRREWIEYRPNSHINGETPLDFLVPPLSFGYMDLGKSTLRVKPRLLDANGTTIANSENGGLVNLPLHSVFPQVDSSLQQTAVTQTGTNYPYKAYIDTLLNTGKKRAAAVGLSDITTTPTSKMARDCTFVQCTRTKDMSWNWKVSSTWTFFSKTILFCAQSLLPIKFWPSSNAFLLMSSEDRAAYKILIIDVSSKLCIQKPNAVVLMAHAKYLGDDTAM
ncbi:unnamed protein product [Mytilus coruscus]|uniref:Uncharacterized protein n=1 Tax=Mytilus coruscus TaxID=42192 RepID=A0A6J8C5G5_MYTCO|nr:unnamed protein product [Mytilus coruscus]